MRKTIQLRRRHERIVGDLKGMIYSFLIGLILCTPLCVTEGSLTPEEPTDAPVVVSMERQELNMSSRSSGLIMREYTIEPGDQSTVSETPIITNIVYDPANEPVEEPEPEVVEEVIEEPVPEPVVINTTDITRPSNLTAEQFDQVINTMLSKYNKKNSKLVGIGDALYQVEQTYGNINGLFVLSIVSNESGWGKYLANTNNIAGITKRGGGYRAFGSVDECVLYSGRLLSQNYIGKGLTTIATVGNKYCPDTPSHPGQNVKWRNTVTSIMNRYSQVVNNLY